MNIMHKELSRLATEVLREFPEVSKIVSYGSVSRGDHTPSSDVDLAFICDDLYKGISEDLEGYPAGLRRRIDEALGAIDNPDNIKFHLPLYWDGEFESGIELGRDLLHEVGVVVHDEYAE